MKDYIRDPKTGALFFVNQEKENDILRTREMVCRMESMTEEINTLKRMVSELLAARN